jgi:two-component system KDP operon response regulator KdpE
MTSVLLVAGGVDRPSSNLESELGRSGHEVRFAADAMEGLREVYEHRPEAILIDLETPNLNGEEFTRIVRAMSTVPILVLGPRETPDLVVRLLDGGADDYLEHPISATGLGGRLRAALRRSARTRKNEERNTVVRVGSLEIDLRSDTVRKRGRLVGLSPTEYRLLAALASRVGKVAPHRYLLTSVWGEEYVDDTHYLRIYIGYLRKKLEDDPAEPKYLLSQWGSGYRLADLPPEPNLAAVS